MAKKLNKEQFEAIKHKKGPLLIIAGAGTGKTTVITERIKYLILSNKIKPAEILALTFTEKAAREMEERVDVAMPYGYTQMWISTFHSFCDRILRQEGLHIGLDPNYKLMTQAESIQFVRNNLFKFDLNYFRPLGNPTKFVEAMLQHFSRLQDEDVTPKEYLQHARKLKGVEKGEKEKTAELAEAYKTYDELKIKEGTMDFGDLILKTLVLFRQRANILREYQQQFKYVLVDEFQDTNIAQNELVRLLVGRNGNITVVADDDQSIYKWRGAAVSNVIQFRKNFPKTKAVTLSRNYRSKQTILDAAYRLIQHNNPDRLEKTEKIDKRLISQRKEKEKLTARDNGEIKLIHTDRVENEADVVAKEIRELTKEDFEYKDIAILVRANNHSESFMRALSRQGIPYQFLGPGRLFKQPEIVDLISYLKVLYDFEDSVALYRLLSRGDLTISVRDLIRLGNYARRFNLSLFEACEKINHPSTTRPTIFVSRDTKKKIKKIIGIINRHLKLRKRETAGQLLYYFLEETGLLRKLLNPDTPEAEKRVLNISKFFDKLKTYEINHQDATVSAVVDWIDLSSELGESPLAADIDWSEINAVNILTIHSAKGLEFPIVFLVNLVSQRFPTIKRREQIPIPEVFIKELLPTGDYHLQEERRLFYVGMTRAKDKLFLTAADYYGQGKRGKRLSPFIFEALGDDAVASEKPSLITEQLSFLDYSPVIDRLPTIDYQPAIRIDYLSYSQIETFRICPLHYKLKYILKIPTPASAVLNFGTSVHLALKDFYLNIKSGKKPSRKLILNCLKKNWVVGGYVNRSHEERMFVRGKNYLLGFLEKEFNPKKIPIALEQPFVVPLDPPADRQRFLKIGGKIDRVDELAGGKIEIIDYKTGANVPTQKQVDHDLQLAFYALAATSIKESPFNKKAKEVLLTLYYFDNQEKISTTRTAKQLENEKKEIFKIRQEMEKSDFSCSRSVLCKNCPYKLICQGED